MDTLRTLDINSPRNQNVAPELEKSNEDQNKKEIDDTTKRKNELIEKHPGI